MPLAEIIAESLNEGETVTLDGAVFPIKTCEALRQKLDEKKIKLTINLGDKPLMD